MNRTEISTLALVLTIAAGCGYLPSVGPDYEAHDLELPQYAMPDAGFATTNLTATCEYKVAESNDDLRVTLSGDTLALWWRRFDDPVLAELVEGAVTNNLSYRMSLERLVSANYELRGSYAAFLPKFSLGGLWKRSVYRPQSSSSGEAFHQNAQQATLDGNWEIDIFGGSRRATEMAIAKAEAAGWTVADAWVSLTTQIGIEYITLRTTQARLEVARTNLVLQSETYEILKSRLDSGIGDELAVNQSKYIVDQTRATIPSLLAQEEQLKNSLAILYGTIPGSIHGMLAPLADRRDWLLEPAKIDEVPLDMIRSRPDVKIAERQLAAATAAIGVAESQWYPKFLINGTVGYASKEGVRLFDKESFFATLGPSVSWPILQGGAIYANVMSMQAKMNEAALAYERSLEVAYGDVRNAYAAYTQEYHRYQALQGAVKAAQDAVTISKDLYKNGLRDFTAVIDAQRSLLSLEEQLVLSRGQITQNAIALYRALGGGIEQNGRALDD